MISEAFAWLRFSLAIIAMYIFFYEYLFKKYTNELDKFDQLNWRSKHSSAELASSFFNQNIVEIGGDDFCDISSNRPSCYVGLLNEFILTNKSSLSSLSNKDSSEITQLLCQKIFLSQQKSDSYQFDFYNWYRFEFTFTDLGHDSYMEFRLIEIKKGSHEVVEKIPFNLPSNFYPLSNNDTNNRLHINYHSKGISLNITQSFWQGHYNDPSSDGLQHQQFFHLTPHKSSISNEQYIKFSSPKTLTQFNFTLQRKDYQIKANITHVIRHNQCLTSEQNGRLRHKCMGGYGKGKLSFSHFLRQDLNTEEKKYTGTWERNSYNLDNSRVRTIFVGERRRIQKPYLKHVMSSLPTFINPPQWPSSSPLLPQNFLEIDFIGFNKLEYYSKHDKIQKQRWVGMNLYQALDKNGAPISQSIHQNHFFINGNIHKIDRMRISPLLRLSNKNMFQKGQVITFSHHAQQQQISSVNDSLLTPSFQLQFQPSHFTVTESTEMFARNKKIIRIDGYWKGWIDEGTLFKDDKARAHYNQTQQYGYVSFYEIMGTIKFTQHGI